MQPCQIGEQIQRDHKCSAFISCGILGRRSTHKAITENIILQSNREAKGHVTIYIGRSATAGTTAGDSPMVATAGCPSDPVVIHTSKVCGAKLTSPNEEEEAGLGLVLDWARANCPTKCISVVPYSEQPIWPQNIGQ